ncbi:hypothetical protein SADUNF_Sadunf10G0042600 [Salix dunnii]|uniref:Auxin-responsive protein n=1 Tax=Salix dunnii TaxID=1413687 RepID=A0A835JQ95_9ROSI|nr:hypothetical protein SADUNF_Sadunf10G0042600 [Salix dunnii]
MINVFLSSGSVHAQACISPEIRRIRQPDTGSLYNILRLVHHPVTLRQSTLSKVEVVETEASSYPVEAELEILTAKDFPSVVSQPHRPNNNNSMPSTCAVGAVSGTKRAADSVSHDQGGSPTAGRWRLHSFQVVGWPPIRAYRMNSLVNQAKAARAEEDKGIGEKDKSKENLKKKICNGNKNNATGNEKGHLGFVKVNMDGLPIGRKVDLNAHACYETLAQALEEMFLRSTTTINSIGGEKQQVSKPSKLLDGSSEFVLTYEDKEGDWMLVGDVPWGMFLTSVKRLRIMKTSEANGLAPRLQDRNEKQRSMPK